MPELILETDGWKEVDSVSPEITRELTLAQLKVAMAFPGLTEPLANFLIKFILKIYF